MTKLIPVSIVALLAAVPSLASPKPAKDPNKYRCYLDPYRLNKSYLERFYWQVARHSEPQLVVWTESDANRFRYSASWVPDRVANGSYGRMWDGKITPVGPIGRETRHGREEVLIEWPEVSASLRIENVAVETVGDDSWFVYKGSFEVEGDERTVVCLRDWVTGE